MRDRIEAGGPLLAVRGAFGETASASAFMQNRHLS